jgi:hypothetical protein
MGLKSRYLALLFCEERRAPDPALFKLMEENMSPQLTPEELRKAKERKKKEREEMEKQQKLVRKEGIKIRIKWEQISSELNGLYEELDKIYKKAPEEQISELTVENVNQLIKDSKEIITEDPYIERIKQFVPAGDNPEYRDAIIVLKQLRQGLDRFKQSYFTRHDELSKLINELTELEIEDE